MHSCVPTVLVVGPRRVGKTQIINHLTKGTFNSEYYPNNGQDYSVKLARVPLSKIFEVQPIFWDGQKLGLVSLYSTFSEVILLVVDISIKDPPYQLIEDILQATNKEAKILVMFGNRRTQALPNKAFTMWLSQFCNYNGVQLFEVNSNNAESITDTFEYVLESLKTPKGGLIRHFKYLLLPIEKAKRYIAGLLKIVMNDIAEIMELLQ